MRRLYTIEASTSLAAADKQEESVRGKHLDSRDSTSPAAADKQEERYTLVSLFLVSSHAGMQIKPVKILERF